MTVSFFFQTLITGISNGMVAYLMVAGVSLIISGMNMVNFGQGAFYVLGTYLTYTIAAKLGFVPALFIVPLIVAGIGYFVEKATRPLFGKNMLYIMLLTYGVAYMVCDMMVMIWGYSIRLLALPKFLQELCTLLPPAMMGLLLVYSLRNVSFASAGQWLPECIAIAVTAGLHLWRRNSLLSIAGGTITYMLLVQVVFA